MRSLAIPIILCASFLLLAGGSGVTSRVRVAIDESNRNWETVFFGDRLRAMTRQSETGDDLSGPDDDALLQKKRSAEGARSLTPGKRTVEIHITQEESENGPAVRKVKKRVIIEKTAPAPQK